MNRCVVSALVLGLATAVTSTAAARSAATLGLTARFPIKDFAALCPAGTPTATECFAFESTAPVPGLGSVTEKYMAFDDQSDRNCRHTSWSPVVLTVAGKGEIDATLTPATTCDGPGQFIGAGRFAITGGSGAYVGATGSGAENASGFLSDAWTGTLSVPGLEFDTAAPVMTGARARTVRAPARAKRVRVSYKVEARDVVDGPVSTVCTPRSGSLFRVGRTSVSCTATDSSANTASAEFVVVVKRR